MYPNLCGGKTKKPKGVIKFYHYQLLLVNCGYGISKKKKELLKILHYSVNLE